jgi:sulfur-carrier protein adenylyltransferase/sulfurtransferase
VGNFCFIDPQILSWENVGRHYLGAQDVGTSKSQALASHLLRSYPHLDSVVSFRGKWNEMPSEATAALSGSDVVVSAIGEWSVEGAINEWHLNQNRIPPVVYGWTEPFACAGHAVVIGQTGGCLQCGFNETGLPLFRATSWPSETLRRAPACGDFFQPYGPIDLSHSITLVAETVIDCLLNKVNNSIHKFWIGRRSLLEVNRGEWTPEWESNQQFRAEGGYFAEAPWLPISACAECGAK